MTRIALHFQSDRHATIQDPLEAVGIETARNPSEYSAFDAVICGSPGLLSSHLRFDGPVVYRLRGNLWEERSGHLEKPRSWVKDKLFSRLCDGVLTPDERLDQLLRGRTSVGRTHVVGLPIDRHDWPAVEHTDDEIRAVTLTNFDYEKKVQPLYRYTATADGWLSQHPGRWVVCGDGEYSEEFADHAAGLDNIDYRGYQPAADVLATSNVMIHPSNMDIQTPNAILEGIASNLPVITSDTRPFRGNKAVLATSQRDFPKALSAMTDPGERQAMADYGWQHIKTHHTQSTIGHKIRSFIEGLL